MVMQSANTKKNPDECVFSIHTICLPVIKIAIRNIFLVIKLCARKNNLTVWLYRIMLEISFEMNKKVKRNE